MSLNALIVGSQAMKHWYPDFPRVPSDRDIICSLAAFSAVVGFNKDDIEWIKDEHEHSKIVKFKDLGTPYEYLISDNVKSLQLIVSQHFHMSGYASPQILYSMKKAHISFPIKFDKHIKDLMFLREKLRKQKGVELHTDLMSVDDLLDQYPALTHLHFIETEKRLGKLKTPKMNQTTEDFFGKSKNYVKSYYTHDNMHLAMAHLDSPVYLRILKQGSRVETDLGLWSNLTLSERLFCVMEEVYVIALERRVLPQFFGDYPKDRISMTDKEAFDWALMRVCTTLCDGFFREFAIRAYDLIQTQYDPGYVQKFFKNINNYEKIEREDRRE